MPEFIQSRMRAFRYAFSGWWYVIRTQRNAWIHALVSILVVLVCALLGITAVEWALIILAVALVWTAEFLNTALEAVVDLASPAENHLAKVGKDVGAAGVLIASFCAAVIGLLIIGPPLWERLIFYLNK
ncbi:MAG: diacylglycerol kinase family protein [Anaerolineales bacterium]|jgi:diacylglycerol kinase (ATP)